MLFRLFTSKVIAVWLFMLITIAAAMSKKVFNVEDLVVHNPSYMVSEYNRITFPIYEYYSKGSWDGMWVHPPFHYIAIGVLMKLFPEELALNIYYLLLVGLLITAVTKLKFGERTKIALLLGVFFSVVSKLTVYQHFSFRPEMAIALVWIGGTFFLECARQRNWDSRYIILGVISILYGACSQYFALLSASSLAVYLLIYLLNEGAHWQSKPLMAFLVISGIIGFMYLVFFIIPYFPHIINWLSGAKPSPQVKSLSFPWGTLTYHLQIHRLDPSIFFRHNLPAGISACLLLMLFRSFRILGIAFLPFIIALTFIGTGKKQYYGFPEWLLGDLAIAIVISEVTGYFFSLLTSLGKFRKPAKHLLAFSLTFLSIKVVFLSGEREFEYQPHPINAMRSLSQMTTGTSSLIGGRHGLWYVSGAAKWYSEEVNIWNHLPDSIDNYLNGPDYFALYWLMPYELPQWRFEGAYVKQQLDLKAVVLGHSGPFGIYSAKHKDSTVVFDFSVMDDSVHRFIPADSGNYLVGSFAIFTAQDSTIVAQNAEYFFFFDTKLSEDSFPRKIAFANIKKANPLAAKCKPIEVFSASQESFSFSAWLKKHPLRNRHVKFYKTQEDALVSRSNYQ